MNSAYKLLCGVCRKPIWIDHMLQYRADNVSLVGGLGASQAEGEGGDGSGSLLMQAVRYGLQQGAITSAGGARVRAWPHDYGQRSALAYPPTPKHIILGVPALLTFILMETHTISRKLDMSTNASCRSRLPNQAHQFPLVAILSHRYVRICSRARRCRCRLANFIQCQRHRLHRILPTNSAIIHRPCMST
jgi:hypothetical protein